MSLIYLVNGTDLLGDELRGLLDERSNLWRELRLRTTDATTAGTLTEVGGAAVMVQPLAEGELAEADLVFFCGPMAANRPLLASVPPGATAIVLSPDATVADGHPVVAGVNAAGIEPGEVLLSPHPGVVALAHLLAPLTDKGLERIAATLVQPASTYGKEAMDELLDQARSILAFAPKHPQTIFGRQLAFNLFPVTPAPVHLGPLVQLTLEVEHPVAVQLLQAPVFHGVGVSLFLRFGVDPGLDAIRQALAEQPLVELPGEGEAPAGMMDSANRDGILVGSVTPELGESGAYWIWAVMDNLTRGGALNAVAVAEEVLAVD